MTVSPEGLCTGVGGFPQETLLDGLGVVAMLRHSLWEGGPQGSTRCVDLASRLHKMVVPSKTVAPFWSSQILVSLNLGLEGRM